MIRYRLPGLLAVMIVFAVVAAAGADRPREAPEQPESPQEAAAALYALRINLELEQARRDQALTDYASAEKRRIELRDRISKLYVHLAALIQGEDSAAPDPDQAPTIETVEMDLSAAEQGEQAVRQDLRRLRDRIVDSRERIRFLQERLADIHISIPEEPEGLSGAWDVSYLPSGDKGIFNLRQSGVLISGEYQQDGGYKGSLEGTLINNKLVLHRIDSKLGPASDLEGVVSADLKSVKGTWTSRIIGDGEPVTGAWTGRRRETRKKADGGSP
jgi:hypothetical protein